MNQIAEEKSEARQTEDRYATYFVGWTRRTGRKALCPRVLVGKRCMEAGVNWIDCICHSTPSTLRDHAGAWIANDGSKAITYEPYAVDGPELAAFISECTQLGLRVRMSGVSPYLPGYTVLIVIQKQDATTWL